MSYMLLILLVFLFVFCLRFRIAVNDGSDGAIFQHGFQCAIQLGFQGLQAGV